MKEIREVVENHPQQPWRFTVFMNTLGDHFRGLSNKHAQIRGQAEVLLNQVDELSVDPDQIAANRRLVIAGLEASCKTIFREIGGLRSPSTLTVNPDGADNWTHGNDWTVIKFGGDATKELRLEDVPSTVAAVASRRQEMTSVKKTFVEDARSRLAPKPRGEQTEEQRADELLALVRGL